MRKFRTWGKFTRQGIFTRDNFSLFFRYSEIGSFLEAKKFSRCNVTYDQSMRMSSE